MDGQNFCMILAMKRFVLVFGVIALTACSSPVLPQTEDSSASSSLSASSSSTVSSSASSKVAPVIHWKTYRNDFAGFTIDVPEAVMDASQLDCRKEVPVSVVMNKERTMIFQNYWLQSDCSIATPLSTDVFTATSPVFPFDDPESFYPTNTAGSFANIWATKAQNKAAVLDFVHHVKGKDCALGEESDVTPTEKYLFITAGKTDDVEASMKCSGIVLYHPSTGTAIIHDFPLKTAVTFFGWDEQQQDLDATIIGSIKFIDQNN